jgi:hypothetical protein
MSWFMTLVEVDLRNLVRKLLLRGFRKLLHELGFTRHLREKKRGIQGDTRGIQWEYKVAVVV